MEEAEALRQAVNAPIQGMAHDCLSIAAIRAFNEIVKLNLPIKLLLDIHDALFLECPKRLGYQAAVIIKDAMERPIKDMTVRMVAELEVGVKNWSEMGKVNLEQMHALCC